MPTNTLNEEEKKRLLREAMGYIFQDHNLFEDFTVYDNLLLCLVLTGNNGFAEADLAINERLEQLGLQHKAKHKAKDKAKHKAKLLSGGEQQRLTLARTLLLPK
ncbi:MAG: ATP-binding cassette domain-containing protein [Actinomycetia bacterium]|nr:ATP-binding cassette domain-containing protein [Actinomycetes bacterium]